MPRVHQSSVHAVAVVRRGVIPSPVTMDGLTVPQNNIAAAPPPVLPKLKYVTVPDPPVPAGKSIFASGETDPDVTVNPEPDRATFVLL